MAVKWDINLGTIVTLGLALAGAGIWVNSQLTELNVRMTQTENSRVTRSAETDKKFVDITAALRAVEQGGMKQAQVMDNLTYRMGLSEATIGATNQRMDRLADSILSSVEGLKKDVGGIGTEVKLLGQKVDALDVPRNNPPPLRRGVFRPLWYEGYTRSQQLKISAPAIPLAPSP